jgi:hypothetical protein
MRRSDQGSGVCLRAGRTGKGRTDNVHCFHGLVLPPYLSYRFQNPRRAHPWAWARDRAYTRVSAYTSHQTSREVGQDADSNAVMASDVASYRNARGNHD